MEPLLEVEIVAPEIKLEASPYGLDAFKFFGSAYVTNHFEFSPPNIEIGMTPTVKAGIEANFFGFDHEYAYSFDFDGVTYYEGSLGGLPAADDISIGGNGSKPSDDITDIKFNWAVREISYLIDNGYVSGYPDKTFKPNNGVTRAEFATMIVKILNPSVTGTARNFTDIDGHWAKENILKAARAGFLSGYPDGTFKPNNRLTRQEMFVSLSKVTPGNGDKASLNYFFDDNDIASWAQQGIANAKDNLLIANFPEVRFFRPLKEATRAEASTAFYRILVWRGNFINPHENAYLVKN